MSIGYLLSASWSFGSAFRPDLLIPPFCRANGGTDNRSQRSEVYQLD